MSHVSKQTLPRSRDTLRAKLRTECYSKGDLKFNKHLGILTVYYTASVSLRNEDLAVAYLVKKSTAFMQLECSPVRVYPDPVQPSPHFHPYDPLSKYLPSYAYTFKRTLPYKISDHKKNINSLFAVFS
jgi:hypothetical protein